MEEPETLEEWIKIHKALDYKDVALYCLPDFSDQEQVHTAFKNLNWEVTDLSGSSHELLLSDNPLFISSGLTQSECVVTLPLSPTLLFIATKFPNPYKTLIKCFKSETKWVAKQNDVIVKSAFRQVYATNRYQTNFIEKRLQKFEVI